MERTQEEKRARNAAYQRAYRARKRQNLLDRNRSNQQQQQQQNVDQQQQLQLPQHEQLSQQVPQMDQLQQNEQHLHYENFETHYAAHEQFQSKFIDNPFGYTCAVCERLWFKHDMKSIPPVCHRLINQHFHNFDFSIARVCGTCHTSLRASRIPPFSTSNGFKYHTRPVHLPYLDIVAERLISPRLPFMVIRRLRHGQGQYGIYGQIINVPVNVNNMVNALPRNIDDDNNNF